MSSTPCGRRRLEHLLGKGGFRPSIRKSALLLFSSQRERKERLSVSGRGNDRPSSKGKKSLSKGSELKEREKGWVSADEKKKGGGIRFYYLKDSSLTLPRGLSMRPEKEKPSKKQTYLHAKA